jgi:primosomal protein N' (replication factor Y) (superfamily II helicase)
MAPRMGKLAVPVFADIILPVSAPGTFSYAVPEELESSIKVGCRVVVSFGKGRKLYSGIVRRLHQDQPLLTAIKPILSVLDSTPIVTPDQLELWERISDHYMCTLGEVMLSAMPGALVLTSETRVVPAQERPQNWSGNAKQDALMEALEQRHELNLHEASQVLGLKDPMPIIKQLLDQGALMIAEEIGEKFAQRMDRFVKLATAASTEEALHGWFDKLEKAPKLLSLLMRFVEMSQCLSAETLEVKRDQLLRSSATTAAHLKKLVEKGLFEIYERPAGSMPTHTTKARIKTLSDAQRTALNEVQASLLAKSVCLIHGVTASGKTELYMELIGEAMERGEQTLYLLPEIALTTQVIGRLRDRFGDRVSVFHSRLSPRERTELWLHMLSDPAGHPLIVGARSSLFLPFHRLGLIVVDEEHDASYKQHEPAPRYHARDMAVVLAGLHKAKVVLGSATPSMESFFNAHNGKYGLVRLLVRHGDAVLPKVIRVDLADAQKRKQMRGYFSETLLNGITEALARKEQAIIFQNRRGYVPVWQCETCGWIPECEHCDVSLTYHKQQHGLRCHYCGRIYPPPVHCSACGSNRLRMIGFGTEKIEEELALLLPEANIARMDQDTTRGKHAFERILSRFGEGAIDILVGTQMVTKGLDFDQVTVVGIINADHLMRFPDMRAHERAFQMMSQVAGRSGRKRDPGNVYIQARDILHPVIGLVVAHDTEGMYTRELEHRRAHGYPPFTRLVKLILKHRMEDRVAQSAEAMAAMLREKLGDRVLGPEPPPVARVRDKHLRGILVKLDRHTYRTEKAFLQDAIDRLFAEQAHRAVQLVVDVDPM